MERALNERRPRAAIEALIALARVGARGTSSGGDAIPPAALQPQLIAALGRLELRAQRPELRLPLLRAWQLTFTRLGKPQAAVAAQVAAKLERSFPDPDPFVSRELAAVLVYLDSPTIVAKAVPLLRVREKAVLNAEVLGSAQLLARNTAYGQTVQAAIANPPDRQQIAYAYVLRNATVGWTPRLRREYFGWFRRTRGWKGGYQLGQALQRVRSEALFQIATDPGERDSLARLSEFPAEPGENPVVAQGPGRAYTVAEAIKVVEGNLKDRDFTRGRAMFSAASCVVCHRFNESGGVIGPDLSAVGRRFSLHDLLESIIDPSLVVSNQYKNIMPPGLINRLNSEELRDLVAYLLSGGDPEDKMFRQDKGDRR
jgi:mono/diheme cytochrome c family protein